MVKNLSGNRGFTRDLRFRTYEKCAPVLLYLIQISAYSLHVLQFLLTVNITTSSFSWQQENHNYSPLPPSCRNFFLSKMMTFHPIDRTKNIFPHETPPSVQVGNQPLPSSEVKIKWFLQSFPFNVGSDWMDGTLHYGRNKWSRSNFQCSNNFYTNGEPFHLNICRCNYCTCNGVA